jgi:UPF0716 protein FxsA
MSVGGILFWSFILVPILEIYLLIQASGLIGFWTTLAIVIITAVIGGFLLRIQGVYTLQKVQNALNRGEVPAQAMMDGILLLIGGVLLLTPGFFTDALGLLCLLPLSRDLISRFLLRQLLAHQLQQQTGFYDVNMQNHRPHQASDDPQTKKSNVIIEGQYTKED